MYNEASYYAAGHFLSNFFGSATGGSGPPPTPPSGTAGGFFGAEVFAAGMYVANYFRGTPAPPTPLTPAPPVPYSDSTSYFRNQFIPEAFQRRFLYKGGPK